MIQVGIIQLKIGITNLNIDIIHLKIGTIVLKIFSIMNMLTITTPADNNYSHKLLIRLRFQPCWSMRSVHYFHRQESDWTKV